MARKWYPDMLLTRTVHLTSNLESIVHPTPLASIVHPIDTDTNAREGGDVVYLHALYALCKVHVLGISCYCCYVMCTFYQHVFVQVTRVILYILCMLVPVVRVSRVQSSLSC